MREYSGIREIIRKIRQYCQFPKIKQEITNYIQIYNQCRRAKHINLQHIETVNILRLQKLFQEIIIDFITKLLDSKDLTTGKVYNGIWVNIYQLTCFTILALTLKEYNKNHIASLFIQKHTAYFGILEIIITDRDTIFTSKYWQTILSSLGTKLKISIAYYLGDRQSNRKNKSSSLELSTNIY